MIIHRVATTGFGVQDYDPEEIRDFIRTGEDILKKLPQIEMETEHIISGGIYMRKLLVPKGTALTGRLHKFDDIKIVFYGDISVLTEDGSFKRVVGQASFPGKAGVKPMAYAHEDTLWATVHQVHSDNLKDIEAELFEEEDHMFDFETGKVLQEVLPCQQP